MRHHTCCAFVNCDHKPVLAALNISSCSEKDIINVLQNHVGNGLPDRECHMMYLPADGIFRIE